MNKTLKQVAAIGVAVIIALAVKTKFERFKIPQNGMSPNYPANATFWVTKGSFTNDDLERGTVVLFWRNQNGKRYNFVSRVIGIAGDHIETKGQSLRINGQELSHEPHTDSGTRSHFIETNATKQYIVAYDGTHAADFEHVVETDIADGHVFVMGDNRFDSIDSRHYGEIPVSDVFGTIK